MIGKENIRLTEAQIGNRLEQAVTDRTQKAGESAASVRVNLSVPARVDRLLTRYGLATGRSKSSVVLEMLMGNVEFLERKLDRLESEKSR